MKYFSLSFTDAPKVVPSCPQWLHEKLNRWGLRRCDVDIILDSSKIRNRKRIYSESENNRKLGLEPEHSPNKSAKVEIDDLDLEAQMAEITGTVLEDIEDEPIKSQPKSKGKNVKQTKDAKTPKSVKPIKVKTPKSVKSASKNVSSTSISSSDDDGSFHGFTSDEVRVF